MLVGEGAEVLFAVARVDVTVVVLVRATVSVAGAFGCTYRTDQFAIAQTRHRRFAGQERLDLFFRWFSAIASPHVQVLARPRVGIIATGNELVEVGSDPGPDQIISSSVHGVRPILEEAGAETFDAGIALDALDSLGSALDRCAAKGADLVVTLGGASVGDHDLVRPAFARRGVSLSFERVAMRPGKPLMHGRDAERFYLGLPGNPVSSLVCARLFGQPLVARLGGRPHRHRWIAARLGADLGENDEREEFMRATLSGSDPVVATPFSSQDSSLVSRYAHADGLVHRAAHAPPAPEGDECRVLVIREWG